MKYRFASIVLFVTAATYAAFAIWLGFWPQALLKAFGIDASTPGMLTEIRAFYGGIEIGIAITMILLWKRGNISASLLIGGLPLACLATGRCLGMLTDGFSSTHSALATIEFIGSVLCMVAIHATTEKPDAAEQTAAAGEKRI